VEAIVGELGRKLLGDRPDDRTCGRAATRSRPITSVPGKQPQPAPHGFDHVLIVEVTGPRVALPPIRNRSGERPGTWSRRADRQVTLTRRGGSAILVGDDVRVQLGEQLLEGYHP
jgi:hypothetical protein